MRCLPLPPSRSVAAGLRSTRHVAAAICVLLLALPAAARAEPVPADHQRPLLTPAEEAAWLQHLLASSPHRRMLEEAQLQGLLPPPPATPPALGKVPPPAPPKAWPKKPGRRVFGYLPYWTMKSALLPWESLTQLAYFSAGLSAEGAITTDAGWGDPAAKDLIAKAHGKGVQVVLTITLFSTSGISSVLATAQTRTKAVNNIVDHVIAGGGDGVNIDFEGLAKADKDKMSAFIAELTSTMHAKLPGSDVTLATPAVDWSGAWDYDYLAEHSDGLMIMAYGLHWTGGNPGPNLPMAVQKPWTHKTLQWVVDDYFLYGKAANKHKFIVGLPLYGNQWLSDSAQIGANKLAKGNSIVYGKAQDLAATLGGWQWDSKSESSWVVQPKDGSWLQTWCDNPKAFQMRVDYLHERDVHMGLWALGYADDNPEVWAGIEAWQTLGDPPVVADGGSDAGGADAGSTDAGAADTGQVDIELPDAGPADASDAGAADTAPDSQGDAASDVGASDTASDAAGQDTASDVGTQDTAADAGSQDAQADAGPVDAKLPDAGVDVPVPPDVGPAPDGGDPDADAGSADTAGAVDAAVEEVLADLGLGGDDVGTDDAGADGAGIGFDGLASSGPTVGTLVRSNQATCTAAPTSAAAGPAGLLLLLLGAVTLRRRRA